MCVGASKLKLPPNAHTHILRVFYVSQFMQAVCNGPILADILHTKVHTTAAQWKFTVNRGLKNFNHLCFSFKASLRFRVIKKEFTEIYSPSSQMHDSAIIVHVSTFPTSSFTHLHVVLNLYDLNILSVEHKRVNCPFQMK